MAVSDEMIDQAVAWHEAGLFEQAERVYLQVLESEPQDPEIQRMLGIMRQQQGAAKRPSRYCKPR